MYNNASNQICIASDEDAEITLLMRNPKQFSMVPSVEFNNLASNFSRSVVSIDQEDSFTVKLSLPQEFLIPVDEGKDITALINLHEPMSGRDFDRYTVNLSCNSKPPLILNPTIMNKGNQVFVVAFDMPNEEEVAVRHKDLAAVEINGVSYPVSVTTSAPDVIDPETPDLKIAHYTFTDPHFKRSYNSNYYAIGEKNFEHNANNSVYFETDDPFVNGDKEYTIILRDSAGLTSEVKASTSISKLKKPVIKDQNGYEISEYDITVGGYNGIPYNEDTERGVITIYPPTEDHLNQPVSGTTVYYRVYEATGSGRIYTSGSTTTAKTLELPQNTYRVEAYATLTNYENSSTTTVKFRFMNNVLYVRACTDTEGFIGDGSALAPYATFEEALADINDEENRPDIADKFTIYIEGNFTDESVYAYMVDGDSDPTTPPVKQADPAAIHGDIILNGTIRTNELVIKKMPTASTGKLKSITIDSTVSLTKVTVGDVTVTNSSGDGITQNAANTLVIDGTIITGCAHAIQQNAGSLTIKNCNISNTNIGLYVNECTRCDVQGGVFESNNSNAIYYYNVSGTCTISGATIKNSISTSPAIGIQNSTCSISGVNITNCDGGGIELTGTSTLNLSGGSITGNKTFGINVNSASTLKLHGNPKVTGNTVSGGTSPANVIIEQEESIIIDGLLTSGAKIGVTTDSTDEPIAIGATHQIATGYTNSGSPSQYFTSDRGFSIVAGSGGVVNIAKSGSSGSQYLATDYNFEFAASCGYVETNQTKSITITPTITRTEPEGSDPATTPISYYSIASDVSWSVKIKNGGTQIGDTFTTNSFTFPAVPEGNYTVVVRATYLGQPHDAEFNILVADPEITSGAGHYDSSTTLPNSQVFVQNRVSVENMKNLIACIHEVTQGEYEQYCIYCADDEKNAPSEKYGKGPDYPVYCVNWYEAVMYCNLRSKAENLTPVYYLADAAGNEVANGREISTWKTRCGTTLINESNGKYFSSIAKRNKSDYTIEEVSQLDYTGSGDTDGGIRFDESANGWRLPTDAEWEYLARGGNLSTEGYIYSGSDNIEEVAWYKGNSAVNGQIQTHPVCTKKPNALGLYDMSGNVYEWCWDYNLFTNPNPLPATTGANGPEVAGMYNSRIVRGGSYSYDAGNNKVVHRPTYDYSQDRFKYCGFRVVRNAD